MGLPAGYIKGITRVSDLVSFVYPFAGTKGEASYKKWLKDKGVEEKEYIKEACDVGTFIHLQMEHEIKGEPQDVLSPLYEKHSEEIERGLTFMKEEKLTDMETEVYICDKDKRYQGSVDLIAKKDDKKIVIDWKTWGIAKKKYNLNHHSRKPYSKLKKVALQMSLYAKAIGDVDEIWVVWLHEEGCFVYKLNIAPDEEIEELLSKFKEHGNGSKRGNNVGKRKNTKTTTNKKKQSEDKRVKKSVVPV